MLSPIETTFTIFFKNKLYVLQIFVRCQWNGPKITFKVQIDTKIASRQIFVWKEHASDYHLSAFWRQEDLPRGWRAWWVWCAASKPFPGGTEWCRTRLRCVLASHVRRNSRSGFSLTHQYPSVREHARKPFQSERILEKNSQLKVTV